MKVNADMLRGRDTDSGFIRPFDHAAVGADIRNAGVGVLRYDIGSSKKGTAVETGIADRHGKSEQAAIAARQLFAFENDLFNRPALHDAGCDRMAQGRDSNAPPPRPRPLFSSKPSANL